MKTRHNILKGRNEVALIRRPGFGKLLSGALAGLLLPGLGMTAERTKDSTMLYIGTYTSGRSQGIYLAHFATDTGKLGAPELAAETKNPTFLAVHPNGRFLYAVGEMDNFGGKRTGAISAYSIDKASGRLTPLNQQSSGGAGPCHLALDQTGKCLLVANYSGGSVAALPVKEDGRLGEPVVIQHHGSSVNRQRQAGPHAHFITTDPANRFALACDLGLDKVLTYRLEPARCSLETNDPPAVSVKPGSGPRHLAFHPNGRYIYLVNEMASTLDVLAYDAQRGALESLQTISTLPGDFKGNSSCAEVQVHPSGKFVYGSNRGHDSIAVFAVDSATGKLKLVENQSTGGRTPRHFTLDPTGKWMLVENQDSNNIVVFRVDARTGRLDPTGQSIEVGAPVCIVFSRQE